MFVVISCSVLFAWLLLSVSSQSAVGDKSWTESLHLILTLSACCAVVMHVTVPNPPCPHTPLASCTGCTTASGGSKPILLLLQCAHHFVMNTFIVALPSVIPYALRLQSMKPPCPPSSSNGSTTMLQSSSPTVPAAPTIDCGIGSKGAAAVGAMLKKNNTLTDVDIYCILHHTSHAGLPHVHLFCMLDPCRLMGLARHGRKQTH